MTAFAKLRATEFGYLDEQGQVYLDHTGAGLPARRQLDAHADRIRGACYGNPHSENPTSLASSLLVEEARAAILEHFNADPAEYAVVFTPNATGACRVVGEAFPFGKRSRLVLPLDNHNSVNGLREYARAGGARTVYVPFSGPDLRITTEAIRQALTDGRPRRNSGGLFAFPAQSNFTGVQHPLEWIAAAQELGYRVLLDAA